MGEAQARDQGQVRQRGNLLLTLGGRKKSAPVIAAAHMDHPGFVVTGVDRRVIEARFLGGVVEPYFEGAAAAEKRPSDFFTETPFD